MTREDIEWLAKQIVHELEERSVGKSSILQSYKCISGVNYDLTAFDVVEEVLAANLGGGGHESSEQ